MMPTKKLIIIVAVVVVIVVAAAMILGATKKENPPPAEEPTLPEEVYGLSGTITNIEEKAILIDAIIIYTDGSRKNETKKILVDENTKITTLEFPKINPEDRSKLIIDQPEEIEIEFSDLKIGDKIEAMTDENIVGKDEFRAKSINVIKLLM